MLTLTSWQFAKANWCSYRVPPEPVHMFHRRQYHWRQDVLPSVIPGHMWPSTQDLSGFFTLSDLWCSLFSRQLLLSLAKNENTQVIQMLLWLVEIQGVHHPLVPVLYFSSCQQYSCLSQIAQSWDWFNSLTPYFSQAHYFIFHCSE